MGMKRCEGRLSRQRSMPFGVVAPGDLVHLKQASGPFRAIGTVGEVLTFAGLDAAGVDQLRESYGDELCAGDVFWASKQSARYATLIRFASIEMDDQVPAGFERRPGSRAAWYVLPDAIDRPPRSAAG